MYPKTLYATNQDLLLKTVLKFSRIIYNILFFNTSLLQSIIILLLLVLLLLLLLLLLL